MNRLIPLAVAGAALFAAPSAHAAVDLAEGETRLTVAKGTADALAALDVSLRPTGAARAQGRHVRFPITGGSIDPATAAGRIAHSGGLRLKSGRTVVKLTRFRVDVGRRITLSARLGGDRVRILRLTGRPKVTRSGFDTNVSGLTAKLNRRAARALNAAFGVSAFRPGLTLGKVRVKAEPSETELAAEGATSLALDAGALQALTSLGIAPGVIAPATLAGTTAAFPITGGLAALDLSAATVGHAGGISLTKGATVVSLTDFDIRVGTGGAPQLFASVGGGADKVAILDLDLSALAPTVAGRSITLDGVVAKLTSGAAAALNAAFGTTGFAEGLVLGTATVRATGR